jgi:hypothetical protein
VVIAFGSGLAYVSWMAAFTETVERHNPAATATGLAIWGWILRIVVTVSFALLPAVVSSTTTLVDKAPRVQAIAAKYPAQVKVLQTVDPTTLAALKANPRDQAAQVKALSELTGLSTADVTTVLTLAAAKTLAGVPQADLALLQADGPKVQAAATQLGSVGQIPAADVAYLSANAGPVATAAAKSPGQWRTWWWICFAAQVLFIPFIFVLKGRWSPRRAREDETEHERRVQASLAALGHAGPAPAGS